jgi:hypothetical protein
LSQNWVSICRTPHETPIFGVRTNGFPPIFPFKTHPRLPSRLRGQEEATALERLQETRLAQGLAPELKARTMVFFAGRVG